MIIKRAFGRAGWLMKQRGFTLVELLVVIAIIAVLAGVALGPITNGIKQARHNAAMQTAHTLGQLCFNYSTDNIPQGFRYPGGSTSAAIATLLVTSGFETDSSIFYMSGQKAAKVGTGAPLAAANVSWCFTVDTDGSTGIGGAGDKIPVVCFNNGPGVKSLTAFSPTKYTAVAAVISTASPQGRDGMAVYYKGNSALYIKGVGASAPETIPPSNTDTTAYTQAP